MNNVALSRSQKMMRKFWYAFWRLIERYFFQGRVYSLHVPYGYRIFTPWFDMIMLHDVLVRLHYYPREGVS